jgi:hypothetical protein
MPLIYDGTLPKDYQRPTDIESGSERQTTTEVVTTYLFRSLMRSHVVVEDDLPIIRLGDDKERLVEARFITRSMIGERLVLLRAVVGFWLVINFISWCDR